MAIINETADALETTSTQYSMSVGDTFKGTISNTTDEDWVEIQLTAGEYYEFNFNGVDWDRCGTQ